MAEEIKVIRKGDIIIDRASFTMFSKKDEEIVNFARPFTLGGSDVKKKLVSMVLATRHVVQNDIKGAVVECGVLRGGYIVAACKTLVQEGIDNREIYLYDTFEGMPKPDKNDGHDAFAPFSDALNHFKGRKTGSDSSNWFKARLQDCQQNVLSTGYDKDKIHFVKGKVEDTLHKISPESVSLLRIDVDLYSPTKTALAHLFPKLSIGGILIMDDYGVWRGARQAADEYIEENNVPIFLMRSTFTEVIGVKVKEGKYVEFRKSIE
jgi:O-methyltransferase